MSPDTPMSPRGRLGGIDAVGPGVGGGGLFCQSDRLSDCPPIGSAMMTTATAGMFGGHQDGRDFGLDYANNSHAPIQAHPGHLMVNGLPGEPAVGCHGDMSRLDHHEALALDRFDRSGDLGHYMDPPPAHHAHFGPPPGLIGHAHPHLQGNPNGPSPPGGIHDRLRAPPSPPPEHRHNHNNNKNINSNNNNNTTNTNNNTHNNNGDIRHENNVEFERLETHPDSCIGSGGGNGRTPAQDFSNGNILGVRADANMNVKQCSISEPPRTLLGPHDLVSECSDLKGSECNGFSPYTLLQDRSNVDHHRRPIPALTAADLDSPGFCAGCGGRILDRYYLFAVEKQWHTHCLTCTDCHFRLDSEITCFAKDGNIYCKTDYYRRFAVKNCARCQQPISANELIMRARDQVFHLTCFACTACHRTLKSGEQYGLRDGLLYCRMDYELMFQGEFGLPAGHLSPGILGAGGHGAGHLSPGGVGGGGGGGGGAHIAFYNGVGAVQKGRPRKRKMQMSDPDGCPPLGDHLSGATTSLYNTTAMVSDLQWSPWAGSTGLDNPDRPGDVLDRDGYPHQTPRQKRVRTSFKHHQLRTMKSYFALNHNPDAKDLKQLAQKTGLSKRVLQVWFQNARAKYRRNLLKQQDSTEGGKTGQGENGQGSPEGHDLKDGMKDTGSTCDMNAGSPALSDISSTPSLSDIQSSNMETDHNSSSNNSISDLFSSTIATIN